MFTEAENAAVTRVELNSVFYQSFNERTELPQVATADDAEIFIPINTEDSGYFYEQYMGVGLYSQTGESSTVGNSTPKAANKTFVQVLDWTNSVYLSKNMFDDNKHGVWSATIQSMAAMAKTTMTKNAFSIWRGAFSTTLTPDGAALCGTHTLLSGATYTNSFSGAGSVLSSTSVNNAITYLAQQPNQKGIPMGNTPNMLLVPSALFTLALQITDSALVNDTANNAINVYRSTYGFKVKTSIWLDAVNGGSDTAWFMLAKFHGVRRLIRQGITTNFRDWSMSDNRQYFYQANFRESYFAADYAGVVGFVGA